MPNTVIFNNCFGIPVSPCPPHVLTNLFNFPKIGSNISENKNDWSEFLQKVVRLREKKKPSIDIGATIEKKSTNALQEKQFKYTAVRRLLRKQLAIKCSLFL